MRRSHDSRSRRAAGRRGLARLAAAGLVSAGPVSAGLISAGPIPVGLAAALAAAPAPAAARPFTVEDLLRRDGFGAITLAPGGRLLVEQRRPFGEGPEFGYGRLNVLFRTRPMVADVAAGGPLRPLFPTEPGTGYALGSVSPHGDFVAVHRLQGEAWTLGAAALATGAVRWLDLTPEAPSVTRGLVWTSPRELLVFALPPGETPYEVRANRPQWAGPPRWAATARGEASVTAVGSGRYAGVRPQAPPKRLVRVDVASGAAQVLAEGDFTDMELSASGRTLALVEAGEDIPLSGDRPVQGPYGIAVRRMRLRLLDLATGALTTPCPRCDVLTSLLAWSPGGSPGGEQLLAYVRDDGAPWTEGRLVAVEAATGRVTALNGTIRAAISNRPERVAAAWWGAEAILFGRGPGATRDDWHRLTATGPVRLTARLDRPSRQDLVVSGDVLLTAADGGVWRIDRPGRATRLSPELFAPLRPRFEYIPDRTTYAVRQAPGLAGVLGGGPAARAAVVDAAGRLRAVEPLPGDAELVAVSPDGAAVLAGPAGGRRELQWRRGGRATMLAAADAHLADVDWPQAVPVRHPDPRGGTATSWVLLPAGAGEGPAPLVVVPYPGAAHLEPPRPWDDGLMWPAAVLAGAGYAVLLPGLPAPPGSAGPADGLADRVLAAVDAAAAAPALRDRIDAARLAVWGHSFGGYAALVLTTQTDRFRAAVAVAPRTNLVSGWGQFGPARRAYPEEGLTTPWSAGWTEDLQGDMRAPPWAAPQRYVAHSPVMAADRIRTPVLLASGDMDGSHLGQVEEMFSALYRQSKDAVLLTYWGEPHIFASPGNLRDLYGRGLAFLDEHLRGGDIRRSGPSAAAAPPPPGPTRACVGAGRPACRGAAASVSSSDLVRR